MEGQIGGCVHQLTPQMEDRILESVKLAAESTAPLKPNQIWFYICYLLLTFHNTNVPIVSSSVFQEIASHNCYFHSSALLSPMRTIPQRIRDTQ